MAPWLHASDKIVGSRGSVCLPRSDGFRWAQMGSQMPALRWSELLMGGPRARRSLPGLGERVVRSRVSLDWDPGWIGEFGLSLVEKGVRSTSYKLVRSTISPSVRSTN